jgi:hypothetical protein
VVTAVSKKLDYFLVTDNDFENSESYQSLAYATLGVILAWSNDHFFNENFRDLINGEIITKDEVEYQLFAYEDYIAEIQPDEDDE